ncbi:MAG: hypothetical protein ACRD03_08890 [Acidimicrobiales bacterium]
MGSGRARRRQRVVAAVTVAVALALGACGAPRYHYLKSTSDRTFVRVPSDWTLYDEDDLLESSEESPESKEQFKELSWSVAFDASPKPSLDHVLSVADHPTGLVQVRRLLPGQRDTFSLSDLRSLLLSFDPFSTEARLQGDVEVLESREVNRSHLNGSELLLNLKTSDGLVKWRQVALVDAALTRVHVLAISCDDECYAANEGVIDEVVDSWKVTER